MTLLDLWRNSFYGLVHPVRALRAIPWDVQLSYLRILLMIMALGVLWGVLHYRVVNEFWVFRIPWWAAALALLAFAVAPITAWAMVGGGLYGLARILRRPVSLAWCDAAAYRLWLVWFVSLLFDMLHLNSWIRTFDVWLPTPFGRMTMLVHAGWFFMLPMFIIQLLACWHVISARSWRWLPVGALFSLACVAVMRLGFRPLPEYIHRLFERSWGHPVDPWLVIFHCAWVIAVLTVLARWLLVRANRAGPWSPRPPVLGQDRKSERVEGIVR